MDIRDLIPWGRKETALSPRSEDSPILSLQRELNRVFDDYWRRFESSGLPGFGTTWPRADVRETENAIEVAVELPGMDEKDIDVSVTEDALTIKGEKRQEHKEEQGGYWLSERSYGSFLRTIPLPAGVETDQCSAEFKKGVLTVTLPKSAEAKSRARKIQVKAAA